MNYSKQKLCPLWLVFTIIIVMLTACTAAPIRTDQIQVERGKLSLPIDGQIVIDISPAERSKKLTVANELASWVLNEGELIESAALKVFGKAEEQQGMLNRQLWLESLILL